MQRRYPRTSPSEGLNQRAKMLPAVTEDQVLGIWQAITLLGEADVCCDVIERSEIIAAAETVLMTVVSKLVRCTEKHGNVYAFPVRTQ